MLNIIHDSVQFSSVTLSRVCIYSIWNFRLFLWITSPLNYFCPVAFGMFKSKLRLQLPRLKALEQISKPQIKLNTSLGNFTFSCLRKIFWYIQPRLESLVGADSCVTWERYFTTFSLSIFIYKMGLLRLLCRIVIRIKNNNNIKIKAQDLALKVLITVKLFLTL